MSDVINLSKGSVVNLSKEAPGLKRCMVGLGWDPVKQKRGLFGFGSSGSSGAAIDCDASAILLSNDRFTDSKDLVYYGHLSHSSGSVKHMGDNLTGDGDGDDEQIFIDLGSVPSHYNKIVITVTIYQGRQRNQNFGMIENAFIRLVDDTTGKEVCKYADKQLSYDNATCTTLIFGELYRDGGSWHFRAIGEGNNDESISVTCRRYS